MKRIIPFILSGLLAACSGPPPTPPNESPGQPDLTGEYTRFHTISYVGEEDWDEGEVRDTLSIVDHGGTATFFFALVQTNFHICEMEGTGIRIADRIEAPPEEVEFAGEVDTCRFRIVADGDELRLEDEGNTCRRYYCGVRASIDGVTFSRE